VVRWIRLLIATVVAASVPGVMTAAASPSVGAAPAARTSTGSDTTTHQIVTVHYWYVPGDSQEAQTPPLQIYEGDSLVHTNIDGDLHNLESTDTRPDGQPWFKSELIGSGQSAPVPVENVPPGTYSFICTIHPFMSGTLQILPRPAPVPESGGDVQVETKDDTTSVGYFSPRDLTIPAGTTVEWKNTGQVAHSVTASDGSWDSSPACPSANQACLQPGATFSHTFPKPGVYLYYCKLHGTPGGGGHAGTIRVVSAGSLSTSIPSVSASSSGSQVAVTGNASFGGESPVTVAQDPAGDAPGAAQTAQDTGVDLTGASIYQPDPSIPSLFFEWHVTGLPATDSIPEAVRYTIPFRVGTKVFQVRAKLSDVASANLPDDPQGHATGGGHAFELLGNCAASPIATCLHIAWLTGSFDIADDLVRVKVPLSAAPELVPGAVLSRSTSTATDLSAIEAAYQAVLGADPAADQAAWGGSDAGFTYRIPDRQVSIGIAPAGTPLGQVSFSTQATVNAGGQYSASLASPGPGTWDVWAKACFGANCATRSTTISI
jgi:plastocyanin